MSQNEKTEPKTEKHTGTCLCGAVRFEAEIDPTHGGRCNCTSCTKYGQTGTIVKPAAFRLLAGEDNLTSYQWGAKISTRYFCKTCGVLCFGKGHLEQIGGDYVSVNLNTVDAIDLGKIEIGYWDGKHDNWMGGQKPQPWPRG